MNVIASIEKRKKEIRKEAAEGTIRYKKFIDAKVDHCWSILTDCGYTTGELLEVTKRLRLMAIHESRERREELEDLLREKDRDFTNIKDFRCVWKSLAEMGKCDGIGGMEYRRMRHQWREEGYPTNIEEFILA